MIDGGDMKGIDVSTHQGNIDWTKVSADFAMIKATQGRGEGAATRLLSRFTDSKFKRNVQNCRCPCGVYHYFTARDKSTALAEADYFCAIVEPYRKNISLWAALDVESFYLNELGKTELTAVVRTALNHIKACGFKPMLYTNPNFLKYRFEPGAFDDMPIWLAHWGVSKPYSVPNLQIWQYGAVGNQADIKAGTATIGSGRLAGINAACDVCNGYFDAVPDKQTYKPGDKYTLKEGDVYSDGTPVPRVLWGKTYTVYQVRPERILLKEILSWVKT